MMNRNRIASAAGALALAAIALGGAAPQVARAATDGTAAAPPNAGPPSIAGPAGGPGPWMNGPWMNGPWMSGPWMRERRMHGPWHARGATEWVVIERPLGPGAAGRWHRPPPWLGIARRLQLTAAQRESARSIWRDGREAQRRFGDEMRANEAQLRAANPDAPNYATLLARVSHANGVLFGQRLMLRGEMRQKFYRLLTPEQKATLARWRARREAMHRCGGAGRGGLPPVAR